MTASEATPSSDSDSRPASFYKEFLAERDEILKNKWYMSEREDRDVGFDAALVDWVLNHRGDWKTSRRSD